MSAENIMGAIIAGVAINAILFLASMIGSWQLFSWRLKRVEEKLDKHNRFADRLIAIEVACPRINPIMTTDREACE